jgi:hypothetical protein
MRKLSLIAGIAATTIGLAVVSTGSAFAMGCLSPDLQTPPVSMANNQLGDSDVNGASSKGFGYDRDAYLAALAKGNACSATQQSQPVSDTQMLNAKKPAHTRFN